MDPVRPVHTPPNADLCHCLHVLCTFSCVKAVLCDPKLFKKHVAGIVVSGLCDLKKDHAVCLPLASADIISRRSVN